MTTENFLTILAILGGIFFSMSWFIQTLQVMTTLKVHMSRWYLILTLLSFSAVTIYIAYNKDYPLLIPAIFVVVCVILVTVFKFFPKFAAHRFNATSQYLQKSKLITALFCMEQRLMQFTDTNLNINATKEASNNKLQQIVPDSAENENNFQRTITDIKISEQNDVSKGVNLFNFSSRPKTIGMTRAITLL